MESNQESHQTNNNNNVETFVAEYQQRGGFHVHHYAYIDYNPVNSITCHLGSPENDQNDKTKEQQ